MSAAEVPGGALLDLSIERKAFGALPTLLDVRLQAARGEIISIVGPSGCGKSTLLRIICGLDSDYQGRVTVLGSPPRLHSGDVGLIFQEPRLLPWLTVAENVGFDLGRSSRRHPRVRELLHEVGLLEHAGAYPKALSGGMAQRAAIARGLFSQPALLLLDEPFSAVDAFTRMRLHDLLLSVQAAHGSTLLLVTHDIAEAVYLSDRIAVISGHPGRLAGTVEIALPRPRNRHNPALLHLESQVLDLIASGHDAGARTPPGSLRMLAQAAPL
jgi:sulfonate transport system ATP-binding protein